jgi:hypothetical protein
MRILTGQSIQYAERQPESRRSQGLERMSYGVLRGLQQSPQLRVRRSWGDVCPSGGVGAGAPVRPRSLRRLVPGRHRAGLLTTLGCDRGPLPT